MVRAALSNLAVVALAAGTVALVGCGDGDGTTTATPGGPTPMAAAAAEPRLRLEGIGLRGQPPNMLFVRDTQEQDMSLTEDGLTRWSVTDGVPVEFSRDRPSCRYPRLSAAQFGRIAGEVLWSTTPPSGFPATGTWGYLGTLADAEAGMRDGKSYRYASGGEVVLRLDRQGRPLSATTPRGPFTIDYGRWQVATVANAAGLPACP